MIFSEQVTLTPDLVESFAVLSGDRNPVHLVPEAAQEYGYSRPFAHGAILSAIVSKIIGMKVPGPGAVWMSQNMEWLRPVFIGETVRVEAEIEQASPGASLLMLKLRATNEAGQDVMQGGAKVKMAGKIAAVEESPKETRAALVTGGSRGIGAAIARALGGAGCQVAVAYHSNRAAAEGLAADLIRAGVQAQSYACDLGAEGSGTRLVQEVQRDFGRLDVVAHAATQSLVTLPLTELSLADYRSYWRMQVEAAQELMHASAPAMIERRHGRFIFLGTSFLFGAPPVKMAAYVTAKQALWGLVRCMALELGPHQITANMISPGMTVTDLAAEVPQRIKEAEARRVPVRRLATPRDTAALAAFLASDDGAYITGQNLPVSGGPI
jgi:3-oxoacyl-[acyl-carrier protein] reductase